MAEQPKKQPQQPNPNRGNKPKGSRVLYIVYGVIMLVLVWSLFGSNGGSSTKREITWERLEPILERGDYESITVVNEEVAQIYIKPEVARRDTITYRDIITKNITGSNGPLGYYVYSVGNLEHFDRELSIVEERTGKQVSRMHLYYTGEDKGDPTVTFDKSKESIEATIKTFDSVVEKIQKHEFKTKAKNKKTCQNCDMRYYCGKVNKS